MPVFFGGYTYLNITQEPLEVKKNFNKLMQVTFTKLKNFDTHVRKLFCILMCMFNYLLAMTL